MNKLKVDGMHCQNCVKAVTEAVSALPGAKGIQVSLEKGEVTWQVSLEKGEVTWEEMGVEIEKVKEAIEDIGFDASMPTCCCAQK